MISAFFIILLLWFACITIIFFLEPSEHKTHETKDKDR